MNLRSALDPRPLDLDVLVIGGGAAGLSGGIQLARQRRRVDVVDSGSPRNAPAESVHGLLGHDGLGPLELLSRGRQELTRFGGQVTLARVIDVRPVNDGFRAELSDGSQRTARRVLIATGVRDELPLVEGLRERWGRDVAHCPFCHGWEVRDESIGVLATTTRAAHSALLFRELSDDVLVIVPASVGMSDHDRERLNARGIAVLAGEPRRVLVTDDRLSGIELVDGSVIERTVLVAGSPVTARLEGLERLMLETEHLPDGLGTVLATDTLGRTSVPGVRAAGNVADSSAQVGAAAASGAMVAAQLHVELIEADLSTAR